MLLASSRLRTGAGCTSLSEAACPGFVHLVPSRRSLFADKKHIRRRGVYHTLTLRVVSMVPHLVEIDLTQEVTPRGSRGDTPVFACFLTQFQPVTLTPGSNFNMALRELDDCLHGRQKILVVRHDDDRICLSRRSKPDRVHRYSDVDALFDRWNGRPVIGVPEIAADHSDAVALPIRGLPVVGASRNRLLVGVGLASVDADLLQEAGTATLPNQELCQRSRVHMPRCTLIGTNIEEPAGRSPLHIFVVDEDRNALQRWRRFNIHNYPLRQKKPRHSLAGGGAEYS